jgi:hypothetical protein
MGLCGLIRLCNALGLEAQNTFPFVHAKQRPGKEEERSSCFMRAGAARAKLRKDGSG